MNVQNPPPLEILSCRTIAERCVFVLGFARSSTTITTQLINTSKSAFLLSEAEFYVQKDDKNFRDTYNQKHESFNNQVSKSSYAPNFITDRNHFWWEWLAEAAQYYSLIGDKLAFSRDQFEKVEPRQIQSFFEARFFLSRYIFVLRDPLQSIVSTLRLLQSENENEFLKQTYGWLQFIQMWADWVRIFPNTLTINTNEIGTYHINKIEEFLGLSLDEAQILLNPQMRRTHDRPDYLQSMDGVTEDLAEIFVAAETAMQTCKALWQAEQKRTLVTLDTRGSVTAPSINAPQAIGEVWAKAEGLRSKIFEQIHPVYRLTNPPGLRLQSFL